MSQLRSLGLGSLITHKPYSLLGADPSVARTVNPRYGSSSKIGSAVTVSGTLTVPVS